MSASLPMIQAITPFCADRSAARCRLFYSDVWADAALDRHLPVTEAERIRAAKRAAPLAQRRLLASLASIRTELADLLARPVTALRLSHTVAGAPIFSDLPDLAVSISRTDGWSAVAITSDGRIGLDIEHIRPVEWRAMLEMMCDAQERAAFLADTRAPVLSRFFRLWTIKEALLKATGQGFRAGPKAARIPVDILNSEAGCAMVDAFGTRFQVETARHQDILLALATEPAR